MTTRENVLTKTREYEQLLERAHALGTELREIVRSIPESDKQLALSWRISRSVEEVGTAQTYAQQFRHFAGNHLNQYENE